MEDFMIIGQEDIMLNTVVNNKEEAIRLAGGILVNKGSVNGDYVESMLEREVSLTTYMGNLIAIPHGTESSKKDIYKSGISIVQIPNGVDFGDGNIVKVVFGVAGINDEHLDILAEIAIACSEIENVEKIVLAKSKEEILKILKG
jgi:mannitol PTS system EIIA component